MASDVHSGRETVELTAMVSGGGPVGGDAPAGPGDGVSARDRASVLGSGAESGDPTVSGDEAAEAGTEAEGVGRSETTVGEDLESVEAMESSVSAEPAQSAESAENESAGSPTPEPDEAPKRRRTLPILLAVAALALVLDVVSKLLVVANLSDRGPVRLPGGFLYLTLIRNSGAAFSIGESQTWLFTIIAAAVVVVILRVARRLRSVPWACALGLLLGGALGNLGDRVFRAPGLFRGHVVDFVQFPTFPIVHYDFPVFNLADSAIVVGGCLMVLLSFLGMQPDGTRHEPEKKD